MDQTCASRVIHAGQLRRRPMLGAVLPVVVAVLIVLTGLVMTQLRRGVLDERLAGNAQETVQLDAAVQSVLRWCEARLTLHPLETATVPPGSAATAPAWRQPANWLSGNALQLGEAANELLGSDLVEAGCVIEDATCELAPPVSPTGQPATGCNGIDERWRKFRVTARASAPASDLPGGQRLMFTQSELRVFTD